MLIETTKELLNQLGLPKREPFKVEPIIDSKLGTVTIYFENVSSYASRVDRFLTLFKSFDDDRIVGYHLTGLKKFKDAWQS